MDPVRSWPRVCWGSAAKQCWHLPNGFARWSTATVSGPRLRVQLSPGGWFLRVMRGTDQLLFRRLLRVVMRFPGWVVTALLVALRVALRGARDGVCHRGEVRRHRSRPRGAKAAARGLRPTATAAHCLPTRPPRAARPGPQRDGSVPNANRPRMEWAAPTSNQRKCLSLPGEA